MSLSHDLACAESDVAHINLNEKFDYLISDIKYIYITSTATPLKMPLAKTAEK